MLNKNPFDVLQNTHEITPPGELTERNEQEAFNEAVLETYKLFLDSGLSNPEELALERVLNSYDKNKHQMLRERYEAQSSEKVRQIREKYLKTEAQICVEAALEALSDEEFDELYTDERIDEIITTAGDIAVIKGLELEEIRSFLEAERSKITSRLRSFEKLFSYLEQTLEAEELPDEKIKSVLEKIKQSRAIKDLLKYIDHISKVTEEIENLKSKSASEVWRIFFREELETRIFAMIHAPSLKEWDKEIKDIERELSFSDNERKDRMRRGDLLEEEDLEIKARRTEFKKILKLLRNNSGMHSLFEYDPHQVFSALEDLYQSANINNFKELLEDIACKSEIKLKKMNTRYQGYNHSARKDKPKSKFAKAWLAYLSNNKFKLAA